MRASYLKIDRTFDTRFEEFLPSQKHLASLRASILTAASRLYNLKVVLLQLSLCCSHG